MQEIVYEMLLKSLVTPLGSIVAAPISEAGKGVLDANDLWDYGRKFPFVYLTHCLVQKMFFKKKFFADAKSNLISGSIALITTNWIDRYVVADKVSGSQDNYFYP